MGLCTTIQAHITLINGALHEHSEEELDRLRELIGGLFCEDISFARTNFKPIIDDGSELSVRRVLLLCHMVSMSAELLWKCRNSPSTRGRLLRLCAGSFMSASIACVSRLVWHLQGILQSCDPEATG